MIPMPEAKAESSMYTAMPSQLMAFHPTTYNKF